MAWIQIVQKVLDRGKMATSSRLTLPPDSRFAPYLIAVPEHGGTTDAVADILREAIFDGTLQSSVWLREKELAQELSVSRTPIREALRRLAAESLVIITPHQGATVAPVTLEFILEVYAVRENLEGLAARLAAKHRSEEHLEQLEKTQGHMRQAAAADKEQIEMLTRTNLAFHKAVRRASGNRYLNQFLTQVEYAVRRFGRSTLEMPGRPEEALEEHDRIVDAIVAGDADAAEEHARGHMQRARELRIQMLLR